MQAKPPPHPQAPQGPFQLPGSRLQGLLSGHFPGSHRLRAPPLIELMEVGRRRVCAQGLAEKWSASPDLPKPSANPVSCIQSN